MKIQITKTGTRKNLSFFAIVFLMLTGTLSIVAQPVANAGVNQTICFGSNASLLGSASGGTAPYTYSWAPAGTLSNSNIANPVATPTTTTTYTLTVTDNLAATSVAAVTITVNTVSPPSASSNAPVCDGSPLNLSASFVVGAAYFWTGPNGFTSTLQNPLISVASIANSGTYSVSASVGGCTSAVSNATVIVNPNPTVTVNSASICSGQTATLTAAGATTYNWNPGTFFTATINVSPVTTTTYTVTGTSTSGCMGTAISTLTVLPLPTVNAGGNLTACLGTPLFFSGTGASFYFWDFGDGGTSTLSNPSHGYSTPGSYVVFVNGTDPNGCIGSDTVSVTITSPLTLSSSFTATTCNGSCDGSATTIASGGTVPYTYNWSSGGTTSSVLGLCAGTYTLTVTDVNGCGVNDSISITQPAAINANLTSTNPSCFGACNGNATASPTGGTSPYSYLWSPGGATSSTYAGLCAGNYTVNVSDANGCISSAGVTMNSPSPINVTTSPVQTICSAASAMIYAFSTGGSAPYTYQWNDGGTNFSTIDTTTVSPVTSTAYTVTVTDATGCSTNGFTSVTVAANTNINGHVSHSGGSLSSGINKAVLFKNLSVLISFDTVQVTTVDGSGNYNFPSVDQGDYLIKIFSDTLFYPLAVPTYYGNHYLWDSASVISHGCSVANIADITMVEGLTGVGPGFLYGNIAEGAGFGRAPGDPVPGIDIKLGRNPGGQLVTNTQTDSNGDYAFTNLPVDSYIIFVDIPGLGRDSTYIVDVTLTNNQFNNLDYSVDSTMIHPVLNSGVGINNTIIKENKFNVYPNPSKDISTIEYAIASDAKVTLAVYNVLGIKVMDLLNTKQSAGTYKYLVDAKNHNLNAGIYFITLVRDGEASTQRLVVVD